MPWKDNIYDGTGIRLNRRLHRSREMTRLSRMADGRGTVADCQPSVLDGHMYLWPQTASYGAQLIAGHDSRLGAYDNSARCLELVCSVSRWLYSTEASFFDQFAHP